MKIEELMTKQVQTCRAQDTLARAAQIMWEQDCGVVPVVDDEGRVVGMLTDRDGFMATYTQGRRLDEVTVGSAMAHKVYACQPGDDIHTAERLMREAKIHRLPIVDAEGRLAGILALADLARHVHRTGRKPDDGLSTQSVALTLAAISSARADASPN